MTPILAETIQIGFGALILILIVIFLFWRQR